MEKLYSLNFKEIIRTTRSEGVVLWVAIAYIIIEYVRPQSIYESLSSLPLGQVVIVFGILMRFFKPEPLVKSRINSLVFLYAIIVLFSSFAAIYPSFALKNWIDFTQWLIVYFLLINLVTNERRFFIVFLIYRLANLKMAQHGFRSWAGAGFAWRNWGVTGAPGWFENSGEFGIQMCIFVPMSFYMLMGLKKYLSKTKFIILSFVPVMGLGSIIATSSRGALVGIFAVFIWFLLGSKHKVATFVLLSFTAMVVIYFIPDQSLDRFKTMGEDSDSLNRLRFWLAGWEMMKDYPVFGVGYGNWLPVYAEFYSGGARTQVSHNIFVQAGSELGFTGLFVLLLLLIGYYKTNKNIRHMADKLNDDFAFNISKGLDAAMVGFVVSGSFVTVLYYPYLWINLVFSTTLYWYVYQKYKEQGLDKKKRVNR